MPADEPAFATIAIAGLGLIGGSIALAVRERWPSIRIVGVDQPAVLAHAMGSGAIDRSAASLDEIGVPDLVVLAAPVAQNIGLLQQLTARARGPAGKAGGAALTRMVVTDVGGTKRDIMEVARALPGDVAFIGGHPIGGAERGGF